MRETFRGVSELHDLAQHEPTINEILHHNDVARERVPELVAWALSESVQHELRYEADEAEARAEDRAYQADEILFGRLGSLGLVAFAVLMIRPVRAWWHFNTPR